MAVRRNLLALLLLVVGATNAAAAEAPLWDHDRHWYTIAASVAAAGLVSVRLTTSADETPLLGPVFDFDAHQLQDPTQAHVVGRPHKPETVDNLQLGLFLLGGAAGAMSLAAMSPDGPAYSRTVFDTFMAFMETMTTTYAITEAAKFGVGRLRPDFLDRYVVYECAKVPDDAECLKGRQSFPSGHASLSAAVAMYGALVIGGQLVWNERVRADERWGTLAVGVTAQVTLLGTAAYIAWSRTADNWHHDTDVVVGSLLGAAMANLSYWTYFNAEGSPRALDVVPSIVATQEGLQLAVGGRF